MKGIYLDNSATAKPSAKAISAMLPFYNDCWGTATAPHQGGNELLAPMQESCKAIYKTLGATPEDLFVFTASGAEAVNQVFHTAYWGKSRLSNRKDYIVAATAEAPALMCVARLEELGCRGILLEPKDGIVTAAMLESSLTPETALVSLSWAHGLTGLIQPVAELGALCRSKGVAFHLDATHIIGKLMCETSFSDYLTFNGEQFHAPQGTGGLLFRQGVERFPLIVGGIEQAALRAGSVNIPALVALSIACCEADENRDFVGTGVAHQRHLFEEKIVVRCPRAKILFRDHERLPTTSVVAFPGIVNEALLFALNRRKVYASIGGGAFQQLAVVLESCGIPPEIAHSSLAFSLSRDTTADELDKAVEMIAEATQQFAGILL